MISISQRSHQMRFKLVYKNCYEQECIPVGCVPPACCPYLPACTAPGGVCSGWGGSAPRRGRGGVFSRGGVCSQGGVSARGGGDQLALSQTRPPCEQNSSHTLLKILPCPNFVAGSKNEFKKNWVWKKHLGNSAPNCAHIHYHWLNFKL